MSSQTLARALVDGLWPDGSAWDPATGGDLDDLLDGIGDNWQRLHDQMAVLADLRSPAWTTMLPDLEAEYGITPDPSRTEAQRRTLVAYRRGGRYRQSTLPILQKALDDVGFGNGGFGLQVYDNNGGANPALFASGTPTPNITVGGPGQYLGQTVAFMGFSGGAGELLVNGPLGTAPVPQWWGLGNFYLGQTKGVLGYYEATLNPAPVYSIPALPAYWPFFAFLGSGATYTGLTLTGMTLVNIPATRRPELIDLVMRLKPIHLWVVLYINWT